LNIIFEKAEVLLEFYSNLMI